MCCDRPPTRLFLLSLAAYASLLSSCAAHAPDNDFEDVKLSKLAFGSCSKPFWPQPLWGAIREQAPQVWLWTGDAVYLGGDQPDDLKTAYRSQLEREDYRQFLSTGVIVEGVYDDHDYGKNDAGKFLRDREGSQQAFLDFIGVDRHSARRRRQGLYSSHNFGNSTDVVKVILLDTRYHRDSHFIPSIGSFKIPFSALVAAFTRWLCGTLGLGLDHGGDILGEEQWLWLEDELKNSRAAVHILVSSIQVLTSNNLVESWKHFPRSKRKLLELILRYRPSNLVILSGDVHFAELSGRPAVEVTSSGMTHTCATVWWGRACGPIVGAYQEHRERPGDWYTGYNFGTVEIDWGGRGKGIKPVVRASIRNVNGTAVKSISIEEDPSKALKDALEAMVQERERGEGRMYWTLMAGSVVLSVVLVIIMRILQ